MPAFSYNRVSDIEENLQATQFAPDQLDQERPHLRPRSSTLM